MQAAPPPRLMGGAIASVLLHGGLVAAFLLLRASPPPPSPPVYRVQLIAAPAGERQVGVVQPPRAEPQPAPETPPEPKPTPVTPRERVPTTKAKTAPTPRAATPTAPKKTTETAKKETPQPTAGGGPTGGTGADVANVSTPGIEFRYPYYTQNIVRRIIQQFGSSNTRLVAEVRFVIKRDGSVDPSSIQLVTRSGNYAFDQKALSAVEAVANAKLFGPLPDGFREDILPVTFRFSPQLIR